MLRVARVFVAMLTWGCHDDERILKEKAVIAKCVRSA